MQSNRLRCYSSYILLAGVLTSLILAQFLFTKFSKLTLMSRCRISSLLIQILYFLLMIQRLNHISSELESIIQWLLETSGGLFLICTVAYTIGYIKTPHALRESLLFEIDLDPIDRVSATLWNHFFTELWIYSAILLFGLLFLVLMVKGKIWCERRKRKQAFEQIIVAEEYDSEKYGNQRSCSICLMDYEDKEDISRIPCNHIFHPVCLEGWIIHNWTCPLCRADILV